MNYVYAALLLHKSGKEITEESVTKVLKAAGIDPEEAKVKALVAALEDVDIDETIEKASFAPAQAVAASPSESSEDSDDEKEEDDDEDDDEKSEEEVSDGLSNLFG
ncbi:MAG: 50S ribosomal protein P1 [Candidatus Woesearchaeota archaeon]